DLAVAGHGRTPVLAHRDNGRPVKHPSHPPRCGQRRFIRPAAVSAFLVAARHPHRFPAPALLNHVLPAAWARVRRRPLPAGNPAVGITAPDLKDATPTGTTPHHH